MGTPSPKTIALLDHIEKTLAEGPLSGAGAPTEDRLLFLGSWQVTLPMLILRDPVLSSEAKVLWGVIKSYADPRTIGAMPDYKTLRIGVRVNSNHTLRAALMELRAARLLSIYRRPRTLQGRFSGNLYVLYDEPLTLADALHMDAGYLDFLREARDHARRDVRALANAILVTLSNQLDQDQDVLVQPASPLERHADRHQAYQVVGGINQPPNAMPDDNPFFPGGQASFAACVPDLVASQSWESQSPKLELTQPGADGQHQDQILARVKDKESMSLHENHQGQKMPLVQILTPEAENAPGAFSASGQNGGGCIKNKYINTTTTPTPPPHSASEQTPSAAIPDLIWPDVLSPAEREVCRCLLEVVPRCWWQAILDELEGRMRWGKANGDPLRNRPRWLKAVCDEVKRVGVFTPALGDAIRLEREKQRKSAPALKPVAEPAKPIDRKAGKTALARLREITGIVRKATHSTVGQPYEPGGEPAGGGAVVPGWDSRSGGEPAGGGGDVSFL